MKKKLASRIVAWLVTLTWLFSAPGGCKTPEENSSGEEGGICDAYTGEDECCAKDDPCGFAENGTCDCDGCSWDDGECGMSFTFTDACDDDETTEVGLYQVGNDDNYVDGVDPAWEGLILEEYGQEYSVKVECDNGQRVCFGAWSASGWYWGCSENCEEACDACCVSCQHGQQYTKELECI